MDHIVSEMLTHYHEERPHQSKENDPPVQIASDAVPTKGKRKEKDEPPPDVISVSQIDCRQRLGGLLKHYSRRAA